MNQKPIRPPASVKNANNYFPSSPFSRDQKRSKAQNLLFQMLMNDAILKESRKNSPSKQGGSRSKFTISNVTTPHSLYVNDKSKRGNSLQKRLEETYQLKTSKTRSSQQQNSFNLQTTNWYLPKKRDNSLKQKQFNQTVPHRSNYYLNSSLEGQNTAEVSFENNILQRGFQGDYSGYLQIQSDTSKNILDEAHFSGQVLRQVNQHHPRAIDCLEKGKDFLRDRKLILAIETLKESVNIDPTLLESHYFLGIAYLGNQQYTKAISEFQSIISQDSAHRKNVYLLLAISFKKINELDQAISCLSRCLQLFPRYYDVLIYKGKLLIRTKQLDKALADFNQAIQLAPQKGLGYIGKADCYRYAGNFQEAIRTYQKAIQSEQSISQTALLKKAITLFEAKEYEQSIRDLNLILEQDSSNSEAYYFKGLSKLKLRNSQEASLCFEQSIKHNNSKKAVTKSLYEIAKLKIEQRDFYAAYHTLNRADFLDTEKTYLDKFRLFTEAVIFLMKRKFSESIVNFSSIQQNHSLNEFLKPLFYAYRAYGYFCLSNHQKALEDYKGLIEAVGSLDAGAQYNRLLCEGILKIQQLQYEKGIDYFERAGKIYPKKMEPLFYHGVSLVNKAFQSQTRNSTDKMKLVLSGLKLIDQAQQLNEQNANVFYIRAIIRAFLSNYGDAVTDVDKAIEKSEDNVPKYFYFRGLVYGCSRQFKPAISDFSICINLDENYADAYLQRARCQFLQGDSNQAFADLQSFISLKPNDPNIHVWAGHFLFANAAMEDAVKAYTQAPDFTDNQTLVVSRAQCYLVQCQLQECLDDVRLLCDRTRDKAYDFDKEAIQAILIVFRDAQEIYFDDEDDAETIDLQRRLRQSAALLTQLTTQKQQGKLFKQHHIYIFRGVCLFHLQKYEDSLKDFQTAKTLKEQSVTDKRVERQRRDSKKSYSDLFEDITNQEYLGESTEEEEDADLLEILEIKFNELACLVQLRMFRKAREKCIQLMESINEAKQEGLQYLLQALDIETTRADGRERKELEYDRVVCLYDEPKENPICFQVPIVTLQTLSQMKIRLSFSLPKINPPSLVPTFERKLVQDISPLSVENKPEAPWIRRNENQGDMIMFTDNIHMAEDIRLETEEHEKEEPRQEKKRSRQDSFIYNSEEYEQPIDRSAMKKNLMLDDEIEQKLKKILEKKMQ